jgi:alkanesulfonate monooxygenase SsuD/methylene tetrahydromethanopterin reductase-like flavin-dependent oxidoreductase (luciferase family)
MATTVDLLSGGRFDLGLGAGWYEREFAAFGYGFGRTGSRFRALEEAVEVVAGLFRGGPVDFDGGTVHLDGAYNRPVPTRPGGPPIWVGGKGGERLLRLVARHGTGWNTVWKWRHHEYAERVGALRKVAEAEDRDPETVRLTLGLYSLVGEDERDLVARFRALQRWAPGGALDGELLDDYARDTLTGTPEGCLEQLATYARLGVEEMIVGAGSLPFAVYDWSMVELIAESIVPRAHGL